MFYNSRQAGGIEDGRADRDGKPTEVGGLNDRYESLPTQHIQCFSGRVRVHSHHQGANAGICGLPALACAGVVFTDESCCKLLQM